MTAQIYKHDNQPAVDLELNLQGSPILARPRSELAGGLIQKQRNGPGQVPSSPPVLPDRGPRQAASEATTAALPQVVLQLPDLAVDAELVSGRVFDFSNIFSWIGIGLGAVVAVALIWSSPKAEKPPIDEAPTWQAPGTIGPRAPDPSRAATEAQQENQPGLSPPADEPMFDDGAKDGRQSAREAVAGERVQEPPVRTARGGESNWDGAAGHPRPGEAAPVGRIKNVTVPQ